MFMFLAVNFIMTIIRYSVGINMDNNDYVFYYGKFFAPDDPGLNTSYITLYSLSQIGHACLLLFFFIIL
jgi:hypothetical protein